MFAQDSVVVPRESSWFWFYKDGSNSELVPLNQTDLYLEDRIGLRTLDKVFTRCYAINICRPEN